MPDLGAGSDNAKHNNGDSAAEGSLERVSRDQLCSSTFHRRRSKEPRDCLAPCDTCLHCTARSCSAKTYTSKGLACAWHAPVDFGALQTRLISVRNSPAKRHCNLAAWTDLLRYIPHGTPHMGAPDSTAPSDAWLHSSARICSAIKYATMGLASARFRALYARVTLVYIYIYMNVCTYECMHVCMYVCS